LYNLKKLKIATYIDELKQCKYKYLHYMTWHFKTYYCSQIIN